MSAGAVWLIASVSGPASLDLSDGREVGAVLGEADVVVAPVRVVVTPRPLTEADTLSVHRLLVSFRFPATSEGVRHGRQVRGVRGQGRHGFARVQMLMEPNRDGLRLTDCTRIVALRATCGGGIGSWRCTPGPKAPDRKECP